MQYVTLAIRASNQHNLKSCNRYTAALLVINQAQLDWPRQEEFYCKQIEEHKQERVNKQSEIADMYEAKNNMGSSSDHKRTNGEEQE